jgi:hypothetical protein
MDEDHVNGACDRKTINFLYQLGRTYHIPPRYPIDASRMLILFNILLASTSYTLQISSPSSIHRAIFMVKIRINFKIGFPLTLLGISHQIKCCTKNTSVLSAHIIYQNRMVIEFHFSFPYFPSILSGLFM